MNHFSGESIRIEVEYEPNHCRAVFSKMNSVTLTGWFMKYANMFKVIKPEKLRNELREQLKAAVRNYE